jgi:transcriptional regulator with XRE-family HTH domain
LPEAPELVRGSGIVNDDGVTTPQPYAAVLAGNIAAERIRLGLHQSDLAERMQALGWKSWYPQTVSETEAGARAGRAGRAIRAAELLALSIALETTVKVLTTAPPGVTSVLLPSGQPAGATRLVEPDGTFMWDGNKLKVSPSARPSPAILDALISERRREATELEAYRDYLRSGEPGIAAGESAAEDTSVTRPAQGDDHEEGDD